MRITKLRQRLLASLAGAFVAAAGSAAADPASSPGAPSNEWGPSPQDSRVDTYQLEPEIVIGYPGTPTTALDPGVTGVGQMVTDVGGGFIGLCTGTLINPRTVIFAAHCVNEEAATDYGAATGGTPIGFGFAANNLPGIIGWYLAGAGQYQTNTASYFYNANYVAYNPLSLEPDAASFLYGDVALASLDTPASDIPTWALLFSALPAPEEITADGTGYHVDIVGYGNNGTGDTGSSGGIDYRRRAAENMLGALASLDDFESFLFGPTSGLPQNLYWIDFDDPRRGTGDEDPRDFNAWRDNPQPNEGITASGDSGGPLILDDTFGIEVVIGVLSGGYTRFFSGAPANGYGTASFYQPLYLYWDWIAANNPYHYVAAVAGDGNWTDPTHWVTTLDPSYQIIVDGELVNGVPSVVGGADEDTSGAFGQVCFESGGISDCLDIATGIETIEAKPIGTGAVSNDRAIVAFNAEGLTAEDREAYAVGDPTPAPTLPNGLPGATNFTPNNDDGDRLTATAPRYFDVTLSAAGTTTLDTGATIDQLTLDGMDAALHITETGSLDSLMAVNHYVGWMRVDGELTTGGDYFMMAGLLSGTGTINTPYLTSVMGAIAPGEAGEIGTLTINGNVILASGSALLVDLGAGQTSDVLAVTGEVSLGGVLGFAAVGGYSYEAGDVFTIVTADGGVSGEFDSTLASFSAILSPVVTYNANSVTLSVEAGLYADVVDPDNGVQSSYAQLLDQNRSQQGEYPDLYGPLDMQSGPTIQAELDGLAPAAETTLLTMASAASDVLSNFFDVRLAGLSPDAMDGSVAIMANPVQLAALSNMGYMPGATLIDADAGGGTVLSQRLPSTMRAFVAAGYIDGEGGAMTGLGSGDDDLSGWFVSGGIESAIGQSAAIGFALSYAQMDADASFGSQSAEGDLFQLTVYGNYAMSNGVVFDSQLNLGSLETTTERNVVFLGTPYTLIADDTPVVAAFEAGVSRDYGWSSVEITPRFAVRASTIDFSYTVESGGPMALAYDREDAESLQARLGVTFAGVNPSFRPYFTATLVHDFEDGPAAFGANLAGGIGPSALFALTGGDSDWGEVGAGLVVDTGAVDLTISGDASVGRDDVSTQSVRASATFRF